MSIASSLITDFNKGMNYLKDNFGQAVKVVYPSISSTCSNCSSEFANKSSHRVLSGSPVPFSNSSCVMCGGTNRIMTESFDYIHMFVHVNEDLVYKVIRKLKIGKVPKNSIITVCDIKYTSQVRKCDYIITHENNNPVKYFRFMDPMPHGLGTSHYILCVWNQEG